MDEVTHDELRTSNGEVLRRVDAGESIVVTNNGRPVAVLSPVSGSALAHAEQRGEVRRARADLSSLRNIKRRRADRPSADLLADSRGSW